MMKAVTAAPRITPIATREYAKNYEDGGRVGPRLLKPGAPVGFRVGPYGPDEPDDD